jgi:hypothetical protein
VCASFVIFGLIAADLLWFCRKKPENRYQSALELRKMIEKAEKLQKQILALHHCAKQIAGFRL